MPIHPVNLRPPVIYLILSAKDIDFHLSTFWPDMSTFN